MAQQEPIESSAANTPELSPMSRLPVVLGVGALLVVLGGVAYSMKDSDEAVEPITEKKDAAEVDVKQPVPEPAPIPAPVATPPAAIPSAPAPSPEPAPKPVAFLYKVGTYTADGSYVSPGGLEKVTVTLSIKDDVVTDTSFQGTSDVSKSERFMGIFASNYKPLVIGQKLTDLNLTKVSGSSLTPMGFNDAVAKIKAQAKN